MKKMILKGMGSLLLMVCLLCTSLQSVFAAVGDTIDLSRQGSITIYKYDVTAAEENGLKISKDMFQQNGQEDTKAKEALLHYAIPGVEFTYLKVGDFHTSVENGKVQLLYELPAELEKALVLTNPRTNHQYTSEELSKALSSVLVSNTEGKNILEKYIASHNGTPMTLTDKNGMTTADRLGLGLYLLVETKVPANVDTTVNPFFVTLPMTDHTGDSWFYDVEVYPKNQTSVADLDKLVRASDKKDSKYMDTTTASEGDTLEYIYVSHIPKITSEATYMTKYQFTDTIDAGLEYGKDVTIYFYNNEVDAKANNKEKAVKTWKNGGTQFETVYQEGTDAKKQMLVSPTAEGLKEINIAHSERWMVVSYSCKICSDASTILGDAGNKNTVKLDWKRTSDVTVDTVEDTAKVYTFGFHIQKKFSDTNGKASEVQFILKNETDGYWITGENDKQKPGTYYVTDGNKAKSEKEATVFSPAEDGTLMIHGLEEDQYVLTEVKTSKGYSLLKEPMVIQIKGTVDHITPAKSSRYNDKLTDVSVVEVHGDRASAMIDNKAANMSDHTKKEQVSAHGFVDMTILNTKTFTLPQTGGIGTFLFTLAGCSSALAGVMILTKKSNKKKEN